MVSLQCTVAERGGVSLVECRVRNDAAVSRRVRVASRLDGPVWPPRREGVPEAGWDDGGYEGTVGAGETVALGFASPAPPVDPPAEVAWSERSAAVASEFERPDGATDDPTPANVLRALGDPRPPADAVPLPDVDGGDGEDSRPDRDASRPDGEGGDDTEATPPGDVDGDADDGPGDADGPGGDDHAEGGDGDDRAPPSPGDPPSPGEEPPPARPAREAPDAVEAWLVGVAARVERGEALATAEGVTDAARGLAAVGGLDGAEALADQLEADARRLRRVADRAGALAGRAEAAADAPVATLRRIA